jgi:hypothetical protein
MLCMQSDSNFMVSCVYITRIKVIKVLITMSPGPSRLGGRDP